MNGIKVAKELMITRASVSVTAREGEPLTREDGLVWVFVVETRSQGLTLTYFQQTN